MQVHRFGYAAEYEKYIDRKSHCHLHWFEKVDAPKWVKVFREDPKWICIECRGIFDQTEGTCAAINAQVGGADLRVVVPICIPEMLERPGSGV